MLDLINSFKLLKGLPIAQWKVVKNEKSLIALKFPYYMKVSIPEHKAEKKGVFRCETLEEARKNYRQMKKHFPGKRIIVQEEKRGKEMVLGLKNDEVFGKTFMIGFGGVDIEAVRDVSFRAMPLNKDEIIDMLKELKGYKALIRREPYALKKFIDLAYKVSKLRFSELDLNPVILNEKEAIIVDARIRI